MVNPRTWTTCWATLLVVKDRPGDYQLLTWWFGGNAIFLCRDCVTQQCKTVICFLAIHTRFIKVWLRCWNSLRVQRSRASRIRERAWKLFFSLPSACYSECASGLLLSWCSFLFWYQTVFPFLFLIRPPRRRESLSEFLEPDDGELDGSRPFYNGHHRYVLLTARHSQACVAGKAEGNN